MNEVKVTYFLGGMCAGVVLCYFILWFALNQLG